MAKVNFLMVMGVGLRFKVCGAWFKVSFGAVKLILLSGH